MQEITIHTEYITLGQFLKLAQCISTGGHAKIFLQEKQIYVNEQPENRRGRKLYKHDEIKINGIGSYKVT